MRISIVLVMVIFSLLDVFGQTPTTASSSMQFTNTYCSRTTLSWTSGDGSGRIIVASKGAPFSGTPANNTYYLPKDSFGLGHSFSATEFVVYNGTGNTMTVKNLEMNTTYYFKVYEYNGGGVVFNYLTTASLEAQTTTEWLNADFSVDDMKQCETGNSFVFSPSATQSGSATLVYGWKFGDGSTSAATNPTHSYATYGYFNTELTVSSTGCVDKHVIRDTVIPNRIFDFFLDSTLANNTGVQCFFKADGSKNKFNFKPDLPGNSMAGLKTLLYWDFGDGTGTSQTSGEKSYTEPGNYYVELKLSSTIVYDEFCIDSVSKLMVVKPSPLDSTKVVFSDTSMCENGNLFEFSYTSSDATITQTWNFGDGNSLQGSPVFHSYSTPGKYYIDLEVEDSAGCYGDFTDSVEVIPQPDNFYSGLDSNYCEGDNPVLLVPNINTGMFEGANVNNDTKLFDPIIVGRNTISYIVQEGNCKDTFTRSTTVHPLPQFSLGNDTSICEGTQLDIKVDKGSAAMLWSTGASDSFTTKSTTGILWAQKTEFGCAFRDSMVVTVINPPVVSLGNDSLLCGGGTVTIDVSAAEGVYVWNDGYSGATRTINTTGYYQVTVTNKCGTASDDVDLQFLPYACDIFIPNAFSPNGDNHNNIFRPVGNVVLRKMQIFDRWGELLYEQEGTSLSWDGIYEGERVQTGQYYYLIYYFFPESNTITPKVASGAVYVVY